MKCYIAANSIVARLNRTILNMFYKYNYVVESSCDLCMVYYGYYWMSHNTNEKVWIGSERCDMYHQIWQDNWYIPFLVFKHVINNVFRQTLCCNSGHQPLASFTVVTGCLLCWPWCQESSCWSPLWAQRGQRETAEA